MNAAGWARHDLIWIDSEGWKDFLAARSDLAQHGLAVEWSCRGRPLVVRRFASGDDARGVPFGLPLPPAQGKLGLRLCGVIPPSCVAASAPPPLLRDALGSVPALWRMTVDRLVAVCPDVRVYGSLAWEHLTQLSYLSATSDLDLLWRHDDPTETEKVLAQVVAIERDAPMRIDGEMINAANAGVHWRELASETPTVIAKRIDGVSLMSRAAFLDHQSLC